MDQTEFKSAAYQRVYQYIKNYAERQNLDKFKYAQGSVEGDRASCLEVILSYVRQVFANTGISSLAIPIFCYSCHQILRY